MTPARLALRIAAREMRGGIAGFRIFLLCLTLGVAAIAAIGTVRSAIEGGLAAQGAEILGGEAEMGFTYRLASEDERAFMSRIADRVSETVEIRSMAGGPDVSTLTEIRGVDTLWPMVGAAVLEPAISVEEALAVVDGRAGAIMEPSLASRLGVSPGDTVTLAGKPFRLSALLVREPDASVAGFSWSPRTIVSMEALQSQGFLAPGTVFDSEYRLDLPPDANLTALKAEAIRTFSDEGMRWRDERRPSGSTARFVEQMSAFLTLMGLAGLAVGGIGIYAATATWVARRTSTLATLRVLGATGGVILGASAIQVAVLSLSGIVIGLVLGAGIPNILAGWITSSLPFPVSFGVYPVPLMQAAVYGALVAALFTLWPLARVADLRAASLYRGGAGQVPRGFAVGLVVLAAMLVGAAVLFTGNWMLTLSMAGGIAGTMLLLLGAAWLLQRIAAGVSRVVPRWPLLRVTFGAVAQGGGLRTALVSIGLGLAVLAAVGQVDANLRQAIDRDLPTRAPSYFFVDIQTDQVDPVLQRLNAAPGVTEVKSAPMLRAVLTKINGRPAREVAGDHWVLRGDRGITYANSFDETVVKGAIWPEDYSGTPQVSFSAEAAGEMHIGLGDRITVNVLGRDIEAEITSLRDVDFSDAGLGFVMVFNPSALAGAPHTTIATIRSGEDDADMLNGLARDFPNVTAIRIADAIQRVIEILTAVGTATRAAAAITLVAGLAVLVGAAASAEAARLREAAILKVLGASRAWVLATFAARTVLTGAAAGVVAAAAGMAAGWGVMRFVMEAPYSVAVGPALGIILGGILASVVAGALFLWRPLATRPAQVLRER
ncbi:ABC transporter permease [Falsirhodobacter sp. alg1]|uniref:ABC transporter permease n=1 Tax=Falsirhodobacter sp. alg1 TaxID=1472418 RepID=UPI0005F00DF8|nr:FtsX-like permease family protein [Falsirhodobacter sp. alg1]